MRTRIAISVVVAACGSSGGTHVDALEVPAQITVSGTAIARAFGGPPGGVKLAGVTVTAYLRADPATAIGTTTTDGTGSYSMTLSTGGQPVDAFSRVTMAGYVDTYIYPPAPLVADMKADANMFVPTQYDNLQTACGASQDPAKGTIGLEVVESRGPVSGAVVSSTPAATTTCYSGCGIPNRLVTSTTDGNAFLFNVTGDVTVTASEQYYEFSAHTVPVVPGAFTTTLIVGTFVGT